MHAKSTEAMLDRSQRDFEQARQQLHRYEREVESLKSQLTKARMIQDNQAMLESPSLSQRSTSPRISPPSYPSSRPFTSLEGKENRYTSSIGKSSIPSAENGHASTVSTDPNGQLAGGVQNWKNAADLTARLRERIESMKRAEKQR